MVRQTSKERSMNKQPSGLEGQNIPDDFHIPSSGIRDVDKAIFDLFDVDIQFALRSTEQGAGKGKAIKVPVIFATGERFALLKRKRPVRDKNGTLILPLISVRRTGAHLERNYGLPGDLGDYTIKTRLSPEDPRYQQLINKNNLLNQDNVASRANVTDLSNEANAKPGRVGSRRLRGVPSPESRRGELLNNNIGENIFEIITVPFPQFYTLTYEVTFWTQYVGQMNQMIENLIISAEPLGYNYQIFGPNGYWYVAYLQDDIRSDDNVEDFVDDERLVRYSFNLEVPAWLLANQNAGQPNPFRRHVSAPQMNFGVFEISSDIRPSQRNLSPVPGDDKFILEDVTEKDTQGNPVINRGTEEEIYEIIQDPFSREEGRYVRIVSRNQRVGETVLNARVVQKIDEFTR